MLSALQQLHRRIEGDVFFDETMRKLYATDASAYQESPLAVAIPKSERDLGELIRFAGQHGVSLIPRAAGTSLAGQVVGPGIVVDISRHFTKILEINEKERWVRVQPGVIRNELNMALKAHGLLFGPETSTASRAMMGGMVGNNSCGSNSVVYGSTREHLLAVRGFLSDGSEVEFHALSDDAFKAKCEGPAASLETKLYRYIQEVLSNPEIRAEIEKEFPKPSIPRRNTGYALDLLMDARVFGRGDKAFNFCKLIAGSEGTLMFITEMKLNLVPLPPKNSGLCCIHFESVSESLKATLVALKYQPRACELIDHYILECTKTNIEQRKNRFFLDGDPGAILVVEIAKDTREEVVSVFKEMEAEMRGAGLGYHFPVLFGQDTAKIWALRQAGLGLLSNIPGDAKPVPVIEDTAVDVQDLPAYIAEFDLRLKEAYGLRCVRYAHAGSGEIHLRPMINLKTKEGNRLFRAVAGDIAALVKKYRGSLSGEHGDGRLRGEFLRQMIGDKNYRLVESLKRTWDPCAILNPGKIVDTPPMNASLRYEPGQDTREPSTIFDFSRFQGILRSAELCNGSGDCRKTQFTGGTMCPSYMGTRDEKDTTRARANILRQTLTQSTNQENPFDSEEVYRVMDLCLSCKGCKAECPSNVDVAKMKAEFLQHYYDANGVPFRARVIANFAKQSAIASTVPRIYNFFAAFPPVASLLKRVLGFAPQRSLPLLHNTTLEAWFHDPSRRQEDLNSSLGWRNEKRRKIYIFCDEFTNYNDTDIGIKAIQILEWLGYEVEIPSHHESGRAHLSKGLIRDAKEIARCNVEGLKERITAESPLIGIEPSAILAFRDEYPELVEPSLREAARELGKHCLMIDEFLAAEIDKGMIDAGLFGDEKRLIKLHGHCHQKALASLTPTVKMLEFPKNYEVCLIPSGCCGMAGAFGYEAEHYELSMKIGELVLFPAVREQPDDVLIAAPGTSCRHQIKDGTGRRALHPIEIWWEALAAVV